MNKEYIKILSDLNRLFNKMNDSNTVRVKQIKAREEMRILLNPYGAKDAK